MLTKHQKIILIILAVLIALTIIAAIVVVYSTYLFKPPADCASSALPLLANGYYVHDRENVAIGALREGHCAPGFYRRGDTSSKCLFNGLWSPPVGMCQRRPLCAVGTAPIVENGFFIDKALDSLIKDRRLYLVSERFVRCDPGYEIVPTKRNKLNDNNDLIKLTCISHRQWQKPAEKCKLISSRIASTDLNQLLIAAYNGNVSLADKVICKYDLDTQKLLGKESTWIAKRPDFLNEQRWTPLHRAAMRDQADFLEKMWPLMGNLSNVPNRNGLAPFHLAVAWSAIRAAQFLWKSTPDLEKNDSNMVPLIERAELFFGRRPLHIAAANGRLEMVKWLLSRGANLTATPASSRDGNISSKASSLHFAAFFDHLNVVEYLINLQPNLTQVKDESGRSAFHIAACSGSVRVMEYLLQRAAQMFGNCLQAGDDSGKTPLHLAAQNGKLEAVKFLIENGADVYAVDNENRTPLHLAAIQRHLETIPFFVEHFPDLMGKKDGKNYFPNDYLLTDYQVEKKSQLADFYISAWMNDRQI